MKILCIYTDDNIIIANNVPKLSYPALIPFGISYIATVLENDGNEIEMLLLSKSVPFEKLLTTTIKRLNPNLVCLTSIATQYDFIKTISSFIKKTSPNTYIILGGAHATLQPSEAISCNTVDAICIGEGEYPVKELVKILQVGAPPSNIQNLWIRQQSGEIEINSTRAFNNDIDELPFISRKMWEGLIYSNKGTVSILAGRGCPNKCTYCSNHMLAKSSKGRYVRMRSPENIINEVKYILEAYPEMTDIYLEVETLSANRKYLFALCDTLTKFNNSRKQPLKFGVNFSLNSSISKDNRLIQEILIAFKQAGVSYINVGLESGSEKIRKDVLRRPNYSNKCIVKFCQDARDYSIDVNINVLIGIPDETSVDFKQTIKITRECNPTSLQISILHPYPGTDIYRMAVQKGYLVNSDSVVERKQSCLNLPGFPRKLINREYLLFYFKVYYGHKPLYKLILKTISLYLYQKAPKLVIGLRKLKYSLINFRK